MAIPTIELLAVPCWNAQRRSIEDWRDALAEHGHSATLMRAEGETWLEMPTFRVRGYVVFDGTRVDAINFEIHDSDPTAATDLLHVVAQVIGWELHPDENEEDDLDED